MKSLVIEKQIKKLDKCRCCIKPTGQLLKLCSTAKNFCDFERSYKEVLAEILHKKYSLEEENKFPHKVCKKCLSQMRISYKFILQVEEVSRMYLSTSKAIDCKEDDDGITLKCLRETPIEIPAQELTEQPDDRLLSAGIKTEEFISLINNDDDLSGGQLRPDQILQLEDAIKTECKFKPKVTSEAADKKSFCNSMEDQNQDIIISKKINMEEIQMMTEQTDTMTLAKNNNDEPLNNGDQEDEDDNDDDDDDNDDYDADFKMHSNETIATPCDVCHKIYESERKMRVHRRYSHMPDELKKSCPLCTFKCSRTSNLKVHMSHIHGSATVDEHFSKSEHKTDDYKHPCVNCYRKYRTKGGLRRHNFKYHNNEADSSKLMKTKIPKNKDENKFLCTICGVYLGTKYALENHLTIHSDERPFTCDICNKTFKRSSDLKYHKKIHLDYNPHQCTICGKAFKRPNKLTIHMVVHSDVRPYKCSECGKTFKYDNVLKTHMTIHTGEKPFSCKTCGETFSLRTSLNHHCVKFGHEKVKKLDK